MGLYCRLHLQTRTAGLDLSTVFSSLNIGLLAQLSKAITLLFYKIIYNLGHFTKYFKVVL